MDISTVRAMIVGGASGMARATAERIAAAGGSVAILDRSGTEGPSVAADIGVIENPMLNGDTIRLDGGLRLAPR